MENLNRISLLNKTSAASTVSSRYSIVQTGDLVKRFTDAGYIIAKIQEQKYTKESKHVGYGKQLIRLRHPNFDLKIDGLFPEIVIQNSYNGLSSFKISLGVFRLVCYL
jgi:hypothetical protein